MTENPNQNDLSSDQLEELRALRASPEPPAALETRVIQALRQKGRLRGNKLLPRLLAVAAALLLLIGGWIAGRLFPATRLAPAQPRFVLLLESSALSAPDQLVRDPLDEQKRADEYIQWARNMRASGRSVEGERLADSGEALDLRGAVEERWKPSSGSLQGFFVISAASVTQATEIARQCPHLRYGGRIEVRPINTP